MHKISSLLTTKIVLALCAFLMLGYAVAFEMPHASAQSGTSNDVATLQAQIQALMRQIAEMQARSQSPVQTIGAIKAGDQVVTTAMLRVRTQPSTRGPILRTVTVGAVGTVQSGPVAANNVNWYQVRFDAGTTGWVAGAWLSQTAQRQIVDVSSFVKISSSDFETEVESGDEDVPVAEMRVSPASFDRYLNRVVLEFTPDSDNEITRPWQAFEEISLWSRSWKVLEVDASNPRAWQKVGNSYQITMYTGNHKMVANREYELVAAVTVAEDVVPAGDAWGVQAPRGGVVIWSETNGHMTNARPMSPHETSPHMIWFAPVEVRPMVIEVIDTEAVKFGLNDSNARFEINFEVIANDRDVYIKQSAYRDWGRDPGVKYAVDGPGEGVISASLISDADTIGRDVYVVPKGSSEDFTLLVTVTPKLPGLFKARLEGVSFSERRDGTTDLQHVEVIENNETDRVQLTVSRPSVTAVVNTATIAGQGRSRSANISGTAANSSEVVLFIAGFDYGSPSFETMRSQLGKDGVYEATTRVRNGRWAVGIPNIAPLSGDPAFFA